VLALSCSFGDLERVRDWCSMQKGTENEEEVGFKVPGLNRGTIHWFRIGIAVVVCIAMFYTDAIPMYDPQTALTTASAHGERSADVMEADIDSIHSDPEEVVTFKVPGKDPDSDEEEEEDDDDDEFTGDLNNYGEKEHEPKRPPAPQGPPELGLLFTVLFLLFEPLPQLALLTLTNSGPSCSLSIVASLIQPEVAGLYFAVMRGYHIHHKVMFIGYSIAFLSNAFCGGLFNLLLIVIKAVLPKDRWDAIAKYSEEVQANIDKMNSKNDNDKAPDVQLRKNKRSKQD